MRNAVTIGALGAAVSVAMLAIGFAAGGGGFSSGKPARTVAAAPTPSATDDATRSEIENIVRNYLLENPDLLLEVQAALETKQREEQRVAQQDTIENAQEQIFNSEHDGIVGNPEGSVTIVEFFDYNCGYCQRAMEDMQHLVENNPDLRFVLKEFPILGEPSMEAHVVSMAFRELAPDKYGEFHRRLLGAAGRADEASAMKIALSLGVDEQALRAEMENPAIREALSNTYDLANRLSITGTPSYVVGDEVVFGALGRDVLSEKIEVARAGCASQGTC